MECVGGEGVVSVEVVEEVDSVEGEDGEGVVQTDTGKAGEVFMEGSLYLQCNLKLLNVESCAYVPIHTASHALLIWYIVYPSNLLFESQLYTVYTISSRSCEIVN